MSRKLFDKLEKSLEEAIQIRQGKLVASRITRIDPKNDVVRVRSNLGLSQSKFATALGISKGTLQNWEQGRRQPTGPAKILLKLAEKHPEWLLETAH